MCLCSCPSVPNFRREKERCNPAITKHCRRNMWLKIYLAKCPHYENKTKKQHACGKSMTNNQGHIKTLKKKTTNIENGKEKYKRYNSAYESYRITSHNFNLTSTSPFL